MKRTTIVALAALSFASSPACAPRPSPTAPRAPSAPLYAPPAPPSAPTIDDVSRARGLPVGTHVDIETLDRDPFLRVLRQQTNASDRSDHYADLFLSTLSMAAPASGAGAAAHRRYEEDVAGFYDLHTKKLYLRRDTNALASTNVLTVAHEEEHALQDRFFGIPDFTKSRDVDEMLAGKALFEGDATLTATMIDLARTGSTNALSVAIFARLRDADYGAAAGGANVEAKVPALALATTNWPYWRGTSFAAQLAESGGWELVNAALRDPPKTTEQVLHVEKYVAGERAVEVGPPEAPDGYLAVERGRMGELQTRYSLAECVDIGEAERAASDWGGDAFLIATQASKSALLWSTTWDDERAAARFYDALDARRACEDEKPPFVALREGTRVAFVQGLEDGETRTREARKLLALVGRAPPSLPPFGQVALSLHPGVPTDFAHRGHVEKGRFLDPSLGLASELGPMKRLKDDGYELLATNGDARVAVTVRWAPPSNALRESLLATLVDALRTAHPAARVLDLGTSPVQVASKTVDARTVRSEGRREVRLALAPVCEGRMTVAVVTSQTPAVQGSTAVIEAWLKDFRASESSPACEALKALRDPNDATMRYGSR